MVKLQEMIRPKALELIHQVQFDCILIDIATSASGDYGGLAEIRQFARRSAVVLMTVVPVESLMREALAEGSIERLSVPVLSTTIEHLPQPALLVGVGLHPDLIQAITSKGLLFSCGTTLQFAMNLLVDGWCQVVLLAADVPGITESLTNWRSSIRSRQNSWPSWRPPCPAHHLQLSASRNLKKRATTLPSLSRSPEIESALAD